MKAKIGVRTAVFILIALFASMTSDRSFAHEKERRDQKILLTATTSIASGKYDEARILLFTLIYTYSDSPLIPQAKLLIFYSDACDEKRRTEEARELLHKVEGYFERTHPRPRDQ
jgi:outer membrane protein assembly factor BamD (BamD/ComL family)